MIGEVYILFRGPTRWHYDVVPPECNPGPLATQPHVFGPEVQNVDLAYSMMMSHADAAADNWPPMTTMKEVLVS